MPPLSLSLEAVVAWKANLVTFGLWPATCCYWKLPRRSLQRQRGQSDFYLVSQVERGEVRRHERSWLSLTVVLLMVVAAATGQVSILTSAMIACVAMIALRCCTSTEARRSVDWSLLVIIGSAIGIGAAMRSSGAATAIASGLMNLGGQTPVGNADHHLLGDGDMHRTCHQ